jgi:hypothetical protein
MPPNQVFARPEGRVKRITSFALNLPVDLTPVKIDADNINWAGNTSLDEGSDFYVANRGDNAIVRMADDRSAAPLAGGAEPGA